jgi:two-component sensor histidine kinase
VKKEAIKKKIDQFEKELKLLKQELYLDKIDPSTVVVPEDLQSAFKNIEDKIRNYFSDLNIDPESGEITVQGQRYVLLRSDSLSHEFLDFIIERYADRPQHEAISIGNNFLYDNAKVIGTKDAVAFHEKLGLTAPIEKLSAGPIHFAFTGWANVEILAESSPTPDENYFLKFKHHNSFEAQSWIKAKKKSKIPVCTMNCGYSAGWCEKSFGIPLTTVEVECEAKGDDACVFIMAPSDKIEKYVGEMIDLSSLQNFEIPVFFKRKHIEEQLRDSLEHKELLIKEIHHRVKNNLQVIISLLRVQMAEMEDDKLKLEFESSINRVSTMAAVHELMYQNKDFDKINLRSYMNDLVSSLIQLYSFNHSCEVEIYIDIPEVELTIEQSLPLALIMNEIICNTHKHALLDKGKFYLQLICDNEDYQLTIGDTGPGFKKNKSHKGIGLMLIDILIEQIDGKKSMKNSPEGLEYKINFKLK